MTSSKRLLYEIEQNSMHSVEKMRFVEHISVMANLRLNSLPPISYLVSHCGRQNIPTQKPPQFRFSLAVFQSNITVLRI